MKKCEACEKEIFADFREALTFDAELKHGTFCSTECMARHGARGRPEEEREILGKFGAVLDAAADVVKKARGG